MPAATDHMWKINRITGVAVAGALAALLAGCATRMPPTAAASRDGADGAPAQAATAPTPPAPASSSTERSAASSVAPAAPAEPADDKDVVGLSPDELQSLLGQPQMVRDETGAEVWQYRARACVLDLYLYPQEAQGGAAGLRVAYLEARDRSAANFAAARCVTALMAERRELPTS
ncbi:MAG: hypothetical protein ACOY3L_12380 [Pseudomonadota bacterium]